MIRFCCIHIHVHLTSVSPTAVEPQSVVPPISKPTTSASETLSFNESWTTLRHRPTSIAAKKRDSTSSSEAIGSTTTLLDGWQDTTLYASDPIWTATPTEIDPLPTLRKWTITGIVPLETTV